MRSARMATLPILPEAKEKLLAQRTRASYPFVGEMSPYFLSEGQYNGT